MLLRLKIEEIVTDSIEEAEKLSYCLSLTACKTAETVTAYQLTVKLTALKLTACMTTLFKGQQLNLPNQLLAALSS